MILLITWYSVPSGLDSGWPQLHDIVTMLHLDACYMLRHPLICPGCWFLLLGAGSLMSLSWQESLDRDHQSYIIPHEQNVNNCSIKTHFKKAIILFVGILLTIMLWCWEILVSASPGATRALVTVASYSSQCVAARELRTEAGNIIRGWIMWSD